MRTKYKPHGVNGNQVQLMRRGKAYSFQYTELSMRALGVLTFLKAKGPKREFQEHGVPDCRRITSVSAAAIESQQTEKAENNREADHQSHHLHP